MKENKVGSTALQFAYRIRHIASPAIILKLIVMGGREMVMKKNVLEKTVLHKAF